MKQIRFIKETACLILEDIHNTNGYIDYKFINQYHCENYMTIVELQHKANELAERNGIDEYIFDYSQFSYNRLTTAIR